jgi:penicillin-binding protein 1C
MKSFTVITWKRYLKRFVTLVLFCVCLFLFTLHLLHWLFPFPRHLLTLPPPSLQLEDCRSEPLMAFVNSAEEWYFPVALANVSNSFVKAILSVEDKNFYRHRGIDYLAIVRAIWGNVSATRPLSGASTITMQTVRLLQTRPRSLWNKCVETFRAWQLEKILRKDEILYLYINRTPYGSNLIGVEAAARRYFGKSAKRLSLAEASMLAGLPQSPERLRPDRYRERNWRRAVFAMSRLCQEGHISRAELLHGLAERPELSLSPRHFIAPHFCYWVHATGIPTNTIRTTLDMRTQQIAERILGDGLQKWTGKGIDNGAVVVLDNHTDAIRAMVGSADFFAVSTPGQINGAVEPRSPGSTLKPFTYALAFDDGLAAPASTLLDLPYLDSHHHFQNYDKTYSGPVSARAALRQSLNIPPLRLLEQIGGDRLLATLRQTGLRSLTDTAEHYGLTLTLGGCEVSLLELAEAYATLARLGVHRRLRFSEAQPRSASSTVISEASAYLVSDILRDTEPLIASDIPLPKLCPPFAWKTGTSSHHRDAWAVFYNPDITVAVWIGNMDARKTPEIVGIHAAAPIACRIFLELARPGENVWYTMPATVQMREVCALSGSLPQPGICPHRIDDLYIPGKSSALACHVHLEAEIDIATGQLLCQFCRNEKNVRREVYEEWDAQTALWWREHGSSRLLPRHNSACTYVRGDDLVILSPVDGREYASRVEEQYVLLQAVSPSTARLYWMVDGILLQECAQGERVRYSLQPGSHSIVCIDGMGRQKTVTIHVR